MFIWAVIFLIIAVVAGLFGFTNIAGTAMGLAKIIFAVAVILLIIFFISGWMRKRK